MSLEAMLRGTCATARLLDIAESFTLFSEQAIVNAHADAQVTPTARRAAAPTRRNCGKMCRREEVGVRKLQLFLSYSRADLRLADGLRKQISSQGHEVWQDTEQLLAGDEFAIKLRRHLRACDGYVVLITPNSLKRAWVLIELGGAWMSGIQLFPVISGTTPKKLPGPLRNLNFCQFHDVSTKLLPALAHLDQQLDATVPVATDAEIAEIATATTAHVVPKHHAADVMPLLKQALSPERAVRRLAHIAIRQGVQTLRSTFLDVMIRLTRHPMDRIRGEAFYCVGDISLNATTYAKDEDFFRDGLYDESTWVQACCANVLKNFVPLELETVNRLQECLTANIYTMQTTESVAALVYYASVTLNAHILKFKMPVNA